MFGSKDLDQFDSIMADCETSLPAADKVESMEDAEVFFLRHRIYQIRRDLDFTKSYHRNMRSIVIGTSFILAFVLFSIFSAEDSQRRLLGIIAAFAVGYLIQSQFRMWRDDIARFRNLALTLQKEVVEAKLSQQKQV